MSLKIAADDLIENPTPRVPVSLCIDTSGSMMGDKIRELVEGVNLLGLDPRSWTRCRFGYAASARVADAVAAWAAS